MTQEQMRNLNTIVETYGNDAQEDMAIEECSELIKAILKFRRSDEKTAEMRDAVIDEIADVQIMLICIGDEEEIFFSCREAERLYNLPPNSVGKVCRGELESIYGYRFGYL